jgi:hypothetical protein
MIQENAHLAAYLCQKLAEHSMGLAGKFTEYASVGTEVGDSALDANTLNVRKNARLARASFNELNAARDALLTVFNATQAMELDDNGVLRVRR